MPVIAGVHYFLHESGRLTNPPLVLIHDAGLDLSFWPAEVRHLTATRVYSIDLPGHGRSEGPGCQSVRDYAARVVNFIVEAGISHAVFTGHGLGGAVTLTLALDHPSCVAGIGLISTGPCLPVAAAVLENAANPTTTILAVHSLLEMMHLPPDKKELQAKLFKQLTEIRRSLLYGDLVACNQFEVTSRLHAIQAPTLVLCGMEDQLTPRRFSETLAQEIPAAALQTVDEAGHLVMHEQPRRVAAILSLFLKTNPYLPGM
jgi:pimeloyl-ACP methyl ester carboxylesterase